MNPAPESKSPAAALLEVMLGNDAFVGLQNPEHFKAYQASQHPSVTLLTCCDARLHQLVFNFDPIDRTFVVQNIGNQLQPAAGSVDYGIEHLHTPLLLILGHTRCGAVKAAMGDYRELSKEIIAELNGLHLPLLGDPRTGDDETRWLGNVARNIDYQVDMALRRYRPRVEAGGLIVAGAVYDFVNLYGKGAGRMVFTNLNGVNDPAKLRALEVAGQIPADLKDLVFAD
jgi:carbonic anhydrase